jgi:hypothetical protein
LDIVDGDFVLIEDSAVIQPTPDYTAKVKQDFTDALKMLSSNYITERFKTSSKQSHPNETAFDVLMTFINVEENQTPIALLKSMNTGIDFFLNETR